MTKPKPLHRFAVLDLLRAEIEKAGSLRKYAKQSGYTAAYLSDVLRGRRDPGPKILEPLGLVAEVTAPQYYRKAK